MVLRALFWITVVAVLTPHEPNLGLGRPSMSAHFGGPESIDCSHRQACASALGFLDRFQSIAVRNLAEVKADIERDGRHGTLRDD